MCVEVYSSAETAEVLGRGFQGSRVREEIPRGLAACKTLGIPKAWQKQASAAREPDNSAMQIV